jgi:hypothetical protein
VLKISYFRQAGRGLHLMRLKATEPFSRRQAEIFFLAYHAFVFEIHHLLFALKC